VQAQGGRMGPGYVSQLLFSEKWVITNQLLKVEKNKHRFGIIIILEIL
jgi:hypothetical protein